MTAFGVWRLAFGVWRLAFGVWRLAFGVRRSAFGVMACRIEDSLSDEAYAQCCQPLEVGLATCRAVGLAKAEARRAPQPGR